MCLIKTFLQKALQSLWGAFYYIIFCITLIHGAHADPSGYNLNGPVSVDQLQGHIEYFLDDTRKVTIEDIQSQSYSEQFQLVESRHIDFGYTKSIIWLRLKLKNDTSNLEDWLISFHENFFQKFAVYQIDENGQAITRILQDETSPFSSRPVQYPILLSPLIIKPGETSEIYVRYWSGGSSEMTMSIQTEASLAEIAARQNAKNFIYYGMMILLASISFFAFLVTFNWTLFAYSGVAFASLLFIMHGDGNSFRYLWPNFPEFNTFASLPIGSGIMIFSSLFAKLFLQTKRYHPVLDKLLSFIIVATFIMLSSSIFVDTQILKKVMILMSFFAICSVTIAGLIAARKRFKEVRFYVFAWCGAVLSSGIMISRHWLGFEISEELQFDSMRIVMISDAMFMGLGILDRFNQLRLARQESIEQSLKDTKHSLVLTQRLQELETQYELVEGLAESKDQQLVNTIHDLRQPLHALRLNVSALIKGNQGNRKTTSDIDETFTYLENLVSNHLRGAPEKSVLSLQGKGRTENNNLTLNEVLSSIHDMFLIDAKEKDLEFVYVPTSLEVNADSLVLMRIITNLVSNSIKYTNNGKILLGCRRHGETISVQVYDTGIGMTEETFLLAQEREARLGVENEDPGGFGYGLAIVRELVDKHGFKLTFMEGRTQGTSICVEFPSA